MNTLSTMKLEKMVIQYNRGAFAQKLTLKKWVVSSIGRNTVIKGNLTKTYAWKQTLIFCFKIRRRMMSGKSFNGKPMGILTHLEKESP
jgi:hypothetical protein